MKLFHVPGLVGALDGLPLSRSRFHESQHHGSTCGLPAGLHSNEDLPDLLWVGEVGDGFRAAPGGTPPLQNIRRDPVQLDRIQRLLQEGARAVGEALGPGGARPLGGQHHDRSPLRAQLPAELHEKVATVGVGKNQIQKDQVDGVRLQRRARFFRRGRRVNDAPFALECLLREQGRGGIVLDD